MVLRIHNLSSLRVILLAEWPDCISYGFPFVQPTEVAHNSISIMAIEVGFHTSPHDILNALYLGILPLLGMKIQIPMAFSNIEGAAYFERPIYYEISRLTCWYRLVAFILYFRHIIQSSRNIRAGVFLEVLPPQSWQWWWSTYGTLQLSLAVGKYTVLTNSKWKWPVSKRKCKDRCQVRRCWWKKVDSGP